MVKDYNINKLILALDVGMKLPLNELLLQFITSRRKLCRSIAYKRENDISYIEKAKIYMDSVVKFLRLFLFFTRLLYLANLEYKIAFSALVAVNLSKLLKLAKKLEE